jgi:large subunit ribosomal protein L21
MYAVIENGGQQHRVAPGDTIRVQKISHGSTKEINLEKVLMVAKDDDIIVGKPYVANASVKAEVVGDKKDAKVLVYKKKPRKGYKKLRGHRQNYTVLKIQDIVFGG